ncbi:MAG: PAS domain S-box protein, partial [Acidobacteriota bacterium]
LVEIDGQRFYQAFHQDITERRRIEAELETGKRELELFFGLVPDLVCIASVDGFFLKLGGAWKQTLGFTNAELLAQPFESFMHPEDIAATREEVLTQLGGGSTAKFVNRYRTKAGDYRWLEWTASPAVNGATLYAAARDITDRKRAEEEKAVLEARSRQAQKMESVGLLAGGVAHDFNNMLAVILGHTEVAMEGIDSAQQLHASLDEIHKAATRSANLTRQLLAFARKETITPKVIDLNETMAGTLSMIRRLVGENVHVAWQPHADLWPVQIDASQMEQVLINLCVNARAAIAGVGSITIATDNAVDDADWSDVANEVRGDYVRLTVSDTGCGMSGETLSHIFEPFFTTKAVGEGTGMGLASVFGAVKQNRGVIQVRSVLGTGTTFRIYLPRHTATVAPSGTDVEMVPTLRGHETLLLVEDEPGVLMLAKKALERSGYTVLAAGTPSEAIRLATEYGGHIHLLMTDVVMPEMNGLALATRLDAIRPHIKRLFTSGYPADVIADHGVVDHSAAFISKPFSIKALVAKVRETLDRD